MMMMKMLLLMLTMRKRKRKQQRKRWRERTLKNQDDLRLREQKTTRNGNIPALKCAIICSS